MKQPFNINKNEIAIKLELMSIDWRLNPRSAPHFRAVWELLVSIINVMSPSFELRIRQTFRECFFNYCRRMRSLINSRPLTHVSCHINDTLPLTPNHFLIGRPFIHAPAVSSYDQTNTNKLSNKSWKLTRDQLDSFWRRLLKEYAPTLIKRTKLNQKEETIEKHDLVWILEDFTL